MQLTVQLDLRHFVDARPSDTRNCPFARAILEAIEGSLDVLVGSHYIDLCDPETGSLRWRAQSIDVMLFAEEYDLIADRNGKVQMHTSIGGASILDRLAHPTVLDFKPGSECNRY